jgi:hypothetical protein
MGNGVGHENPNIEIRNPKQFQNPKQRRAEAGILDYLSIRILFIYCPFA